MLAILILAQAVSATPAIPAAPDEGPPPPSIVERIGAPTPAPSATPPVRAAAPPAPLPTAVPIAAPAPTLPLPTAAPAAAPVPTALPVPAAAPKTAAQVSAFGVHASSFRKRTTAESEARRLGAQLALPARVVPVDLGAKGVWYRVVVGAVGSAAEASALRERLKREGVPDGVVQKF